MKRRDILKTGFFTTAGIILSPIVSSFSNFPQLKDDKRHTILKMNIGNLETYILSDGIVHLDSIQPVFAPEVNSDLLHRELSNLHLPTSFGEAGINVLLIKKDDKLILLDTGCGQNFGEFGGKLVESLKQLQINPSDITDIVISHAHIDHIGGILTKTNDFVFPNAKYYIAQREFDFWMSTNPDFSKSKGEEFSPTSISFAKNVLNRIKSKLSLFQYGDVLFSCLKPELAEGHTFGHTIFTIFSENKSIKHIVDTFHTLLLVTHPDWGTKWDVDFDKAIETRERIIEEGVKNNILYMSCHLPWPGLGYIDKINNGFAWIIYPYFNPTEITI